MTTDDYFAYVRDYQRRLYDACLLARYGLADPGEDEEAFDLEALYDDEDPFTIWNEPLVFQSADTLVPQEKGVPDGQAVRA